MLRQSVRNRQRIGVSAMTLIELAMLVQAGRLRIKTSGAELFDALETSPALHLLPITVAIAREVASLGGLFHDPADRAIARRMDCVS